MKKTVLIIVYLSCCLYVFGDNQLDSYLTKSYSLCMNKAFQKVDSNKIRTLMEVYELNNDSKRISMSNIIMCALKCHYCEMDEAVTCLIRAEEMIDKCHEMECAKNYFIAEFLMMSDKKKAREYALKALKSNANANYFNYCQIALTENDSNAKKWLAKAFADAETNEAKEFCHAMYALRFSDSLDDTQVIEGVQPYYNKCGDVRTANMLARKYLKLGRLSDARRVIDDTKGKSFFKAEYLMLEMDYYQKMGNMDSMEYYKNEAFLQLMNERKRSMNVMGNYYEQKSVRKTIELQQEQINNYRLWIWSIIITIIVIFIITILAITVTHHRRKVNVIIESSFRQMVENYKRDMKIENVIEDAQRILAPLSIYDNELNETGLAMTWMICLGIDSETICKQLHITKGYYYQKRLRLVAAFGFKNTKEMNARLIDLVAKLL